MSTKKTTDTSQKSVFDPTAMNAFHGFTNQLQGYTKNWLGGNGDPTQTPGFNLLYQSGLNNANALSRRGIDNIFSNARAMNGDSNSAATQAILARAGRGASGMQQNAFLDAVRNSMMQQQFSAGLASSYRPLQTGATSHSVEKTGGLGTWLPQVVGAGMGIAGGFMGGGKMFSKAGASGSGGGALAGGGGGGGIGYSQPGSSFWGNH